MVGTSREDRQDPGQDPSIRRITEYHFEVGGWWTSFLKRSGETLPDGRTEAASWARRDALLARRQTHVILFEADDGVDIYAHEEPNALNPLTAWRHYRGRGYDPAAGVATVREWLNTTEWSAIE